MAPPSKKEEAMLDPTLRAAWRQEAEAVVAYVPEDDIWDVEGKVFSKRILDLDAALAECEAKLKTAQELIEGYGIDFRDKKIADLERRLAATVEAGRINISAMGERFESDTRSELEGWAEEHNYFLFRASQEAP